MKPHVFLLTMLIVLIIALAVFYTMKLPATAQIRPRNALEVFKARPAWKNLPADFLSALANKLNSAEKATEFALLCEKTGILKNNIMALLDPAGGDPEFAVGGVAATLTSYANALGNQRQFSEAKHALELALLLKPRHVAAWSSMALVAFNLKDCRTAVSWADKVLSFKPDPHSKDHWERGMADVMTGEGEKRAAEALGEPELIGAWKELRDQMKAIKNACGG